MSVPRLLLMPTHRTGLADAVAAAVSEILTAQGREVRYHHIGPAAPGSCWDRWQGAVFVDPGLTGSEKAVGLYEVAVRHAEVSLLSSTVGLFDRRSGVDWVPADIASLLDCPAVVVLDCRGWSTGIKLLVQGIKAQLTDVYLAGVVLSGVADEAHYKSLRQVMVELGVRVAGCLYEGQGLDWGSEAPGAWGLPLSVEVMESVARQVDVSGLVALAGQRGFLATHKRLSDRSGDGPLVAVAGGTGFTPWSRDSIEVLRSAGARTQRLDLLDDLALPPETSGLLLAGTMWPESVQDISMNTALLQDIAEKVGQGLPTIALGGGMLLMLQSLQDTLGRTSEFAGVVPARAEILWDLQEPAYVEVRATNDNLILAKGEKVTGWVLSEIELNSASAQWEAPLALRGTASKMERQDSFGGDSLLCSPALVHLSARSEMAARFVQSCAAFAGSPQAESNGMRERPGSDAVQ
jgi:cobyrinic acid a,c-diamide synthase